jgi:hypothetical protein
MSSNKKKIVAVLIIVVIFIVTFFALRNRQNTESLIKFSYPTITVSYPDDFTSTITPGNDVSSALFSFSPKEKNGDLMTLTYYGSTDELKNPETLKASVSQNASGAIPGLNVQTITENNIQMLKVSQESNSGQMKNQYYAFLNDGNVWLLTLNYAKDSKLGAQEDAIVQSLKTPDNPL